MLDAHQTSADDNLASLEEVYNESIFSAGIDPTQKDGDDEGELEKDEAAKVEQDKRATDNDEYGTRPAGRKRIRKKEMHKLISDDLWAIGKEKMQKKDILALRGEMQRNRNLRVKLRKAIMSSIAGANERGGDDSVGMELDVSTSWRRRTRKIKNNLGLVYLGGD